MKNFLSAVTNFIREEDGASAVEYGILVAAIAAAIIIVVIAVGQQVNESFTMVCNALNGVSGVEVECPALP